MKLHSKIYGDKGQDLIVIHGLFGMSDNWNTLGKKFSKYCKVHLIDLRNHGRSPHSTDFNYDVMCDDVFEYMQDNAIVNPIILGHSLGGKVAMKFAFTYPDKTEKLIVDKTIGIVLSWNSIVLSTISFCFCAAPAARTVGAGRARYTTYQDHRNNCLLSFEMATHTPHTDRLCSSDRRPTLTLTRHTAQDVRNSTAAPTHTVRQI